MAAINVYLVHILDELVRQQSFPDTRESSYLSLDELLESLARRQQRFGSEKLGFSIPTHDALSDVLDRLVELGILERSFDRDPSAWRLNPSIRPDRDRDGRPYLRGSFGDAPPPPGDDIPEPPDDGPGRGLAEIISHPVLFCVSEDAFDALLNAALGEPNQAASEGA